MTNTYDRELIAHYQHEDRLREFAQRRRIAEATALPRAAGLFSTIIARLRRTATEATIGTVTARA